MSSDDETIFAGHDEAGDGAGELRPGTRVGDYAVERFLGAGAMGEVYLARQVILDQECALKIMPRELSQSPDFERRFGIEGRALAKLNHPSIVRVLYAGQADGQHYLTMEYVDGGSIEDMLAAKGGRLDEDTVRTILGDMLSALDYAHTKGIVHRDLKPANILMTSEGRCKISDFGLALVAGEQFMQSVVQRSIAASQLAGYSPRRYDADATRVETGSKGRSRSSDASSYVGTIDYMSPEVRAGGAADARSDIFAMGVLSYQMLTGRKPLGMARPPSSIVKTLSPAWDEWVARCMEFDASDRFQTAAEALAALPRPGAAAQAASPVTEAPVNSPTTGRLAVTSTPSGAKVSGEDGSIYGVTPLYIEGAEPGRYSFSLAKQGHESATVTGILAPGQTLALDADLKLAVPPAKPSKKGFKAVLAILLVLALAVVALIHYNSRSMTPEELYDLAWRQQNGGELNDSIANLYGLANWDEADPALRKTALNDWAWAVLARAGQSADQGRYQDVRSDCQAIIDEPVPADVAQQARDLLAHSTRPGGIVADSEPTASVQIDGFGDMKSTPALFTDVPPGEYNLVFLADGYKTESRQVVVQPGKETAVPTVMLVREIGRLSIESTPPGIPWRLANGPDDAPPTPDGAVTPDLVDLPSGVYTVAFTRPGWPEWTQEVHVPVDATAVVSHRFVPGSMSINASDSAMKWTIVSGPDKSFAPRSGNVPAKIADLAPGEYIVEFTKPGMPPLRVSAQVTEGGTSDVVGRIATGKLVVESVPSGATVADSAGNVLGKTPLRLDSAIAGEQNLTLRLAGYRNTHVSGTLAESDTLRLAATMLAVAIPEPSKPWRVPSCNLEMVWIPAGSFQMGSRKSDSYRSDDEEFHSVRITRGFWIGKFEVTQKQWMAVMGDNPSRYSGAGANAPVDSISWEMANEFCRRLNKAEGAAGALPEGYEYQLPTEAQWEYACRGGVTNRSDLYTGELNVLGTRNAPALNLIAWYSGNSGTNFNGAYDSSDWDERQYSSATSGPHPVGRKRANAYGLCDMLGNVNEWCFDWYGPYATRTATDPTGPDSGEGRVTRGGNWYCDAKYCRMSSRFFYSPESKGDLVGLRIVLAPKR